MKAGALQGAGRVLRMILLGLGLLGLWPGIGWAAAPTVTITSPTANHVFSYPIPSGSALMALATPSTGATIVKVEFLKGTTLVGTVTQPTGSGQYILPVTSNNFGPGVYSLTAKVTDSLGAVVTSAAVPVTVNARPTVTLIYPVSSQVFAANQPITITATASDSDGSVVKVDFYQGMPTGMTLIGATTSAPYAATWANPPAGLRVIRATVTDNLGATSDAFMTISVNALPTVTLTSPSAGSVGIAPASFTLSATAADGDGTIAKVEFLNGSTLIGTATTSPYTFAWSGVGGGTYSLTAKATDNRGAVTTSTSVPISVIANSAPTISLTSPTQNQSLRAPATITLAATASDPDNNLVKVEFFQNDTLIATVLSAPYTATWNNVGQGSYQITAVATDAAGAQTTSAPATLTVTSAQASLYFIHPDHLGTPRLVTDAANQVVWRHLPTTEPFGTTPPEEDPQGTGNRFEMPLAFPGQYRDNESGLSYNYFRDYSPGEGRYRQSDPIGLQGGINTYSYVNGNPVSYTDPSGLCRRGYKPMEGNAGACVRYDRVDPDKCATAECAGGLTPIPVDLRPASEIDVAQCKLVCQMVTTPPVAACNAALGGTFITGLAIGGPLKMGACSLICN